MVDVPYSKLTLIELHKDLFSISGQLASKRTNEKGEDN